MPDPKIEAPTDAIVKITSSGICGSDLHLLDGFMPTMEKGDVLGHESMGEVVEVGSDVTHLRKGGHPVLPQGRHPLRAGAYVGFRDKKDGCIKVVLQP